MKDFYEAFGVCERPSKVFEDTHLSNGFKFVKDLSEVPEKARKIEDITICQGYNLARYYRWTVFVDRNTVCPIGLIAYGLAKPDKLYESGEIAVAGGYAENTEVGKKLEKEIVKLDYGEYIGFI